MTIKNGKNKLNVLVFIIYIVVAYIWFLIFKSEYNSITTESCQAMTDWIVEVQNEYIYGARLIVLFGFLIPNVFLLMGSCAAGTKLAFTMILSFLANAIWFIVFIYTFVAYVLFGCGNCSAYWF